MNHAIKHTFINRRSAGDDRRKIYNLDYFENNGTERRRNIKDRRNSVEQRKRTNRINKWHSIYNNKERGKNNFSK